MKNHGWQAKVSAPVFAIALIAIAWSACGCEGDGAGNSGGGSSGEGQEEEGGQESGEGGSEGVDVPEYYAFDARFGAPEGTSSVDYAGQVHRLVLIGEIGEYIEGLTESVDQGSFVPQAGDVTHALLFYYDFDGATGSDVELGLDLTPPALQVTHGDLSSGKSVSEKVAGNDPVGQHQDWSTGIVGFTNLSGLSPDALVRGWFEELDALAVARAGGTPTVGPTGIAARNVWVTADGRDLAELIEKFLNASVCFSQAADDYLDGDLDGKGIKSDNSAPEEGKVHTALEHAWDEGFGYFGAARDYGARSDAETAASPAYDTNGDGFIDLLSERSVGMALYAMRRDDASAPGATTDFSGDIWRAFLVGRALIASGLDPADSARLADLQEQRDDAIAAWEASLAASVVHYINETLVDMDDFGTADYDFDDHAKHWTEAKAIALSFQFNPRSALSDDDFATLHGLFGDAPVLPGQGDAEAYRADLLAARDLLGTAFGFAAENLDAW